jgi:hypothetical protein
MRREMRRGSAGPGGDTRMTGLPGSLASGRRRTADWLLIAGSQDRFSRVPNPSAHTFTSTDFCGFQCVFCSYFSIEIGAVFSEFFPRFRDITVQFFLLKKSKPSHLINSLRFHQF